MKENLTQKVIRTYCDSYATNYVDRLQDLLNNGYTVCMVTPITHTQKSAYKDVPPIQFQVNEYILNPPRDE